MKFLLISIYIFWGVNYLVAQQLPNHELQFTKLADKWDEAIPLGNGMLGALIWQKENQLRFSLDRADLWDNRPMAGLHRKEFSYDWVNQQVQKKDYGIVQKYFDAPYDSEPAPTKIPGGALEFEIKNWGTINSVNLKIKNAICEVKWSNGIILKTFVHATKPLGWFRFENLPSPLSFKLIQPRYQGQVKVSGDPVGGDDLSRLGYPIGTIIEKSNDFTYQQKGWGGFSYEINVRLNLIDKTTVEGVWSISSQYADKKIESTAGKITEEALSKTFQAEFISHEKWWRDFWSQSSLKIYDALIEKQWYLEQYKFGSVARVGAPPISLQGIWTADNGRIPPWKGDFHHDLNTQLSYWPSYSGNHLKEGIGYLDHLDENKPNYLRYTKLYFGKEGLAVPGVTTIDGTEMGGWIQYSLSPTVSSWLAQHYYLQWRYSMDNQFLKDRAYPWVKETANFLEKVTIIDANGHRKLPISSSPEINDNNLSAWFLQNTNYDLALMKFTFTAAVEMANELNLPDEAKHWKMLLNEFDDYSLTKNNELMFAASMPYNQSHRHFSNVMAIHPLGLIKWEDGPKAQAIIKNTLLQLDNYGPKYWCGYSYAWLACLKARAKDGKGAAKSLTIFTKAFCSINSFHLNGDQTKSAYSEFTYRPFTLEGNFAFAAGLQEMLLQSYAGFIEIMPAVPLDWKDISFDQLRAEGAYLVSAKKVNGEILSVKIFAEKGGTTKLKIPFSKWKISSKKDIETEPDGSEFLVLKAKPYGMIELETE